MSNKNIVYLNSVLPQLSHTMSAALSNQNIHTCAIYIDLQYRGKNLATVIHPAWTLLVQYSGECVRISISIRTHSIKVDSLTKLILTHRNCYIHRQCFIQLSCFVLFVLPIMWQCIEFIESYCDFEY